MALSSVGDAIPQLANFSFWSPDSRPIALGGQNFTHCCLRAVNSSLAIRDGDLEFTNGSFFQPDLTIASLETAVQNGQFPCGAEWNGDPAGAPAVTVPYTWCKQQCGGWEISHIDVLRQWVAPLVQFILPSLAFCLNIPRTRKLAIPDIVFRAHPRSVVGFASYWIRLLGALLLMTVDTVVWLAICFAFAGPMIMSAVYEYVMDRKVLEFLRPHKKQAERPLLPEKLRAQLLLAVVVGNIRLSSGIPNGRRSISDSPCGSFSTDPEGLAGGVCPLGDNSWKRVMTMIEESEVDQLNGGPTCRKVPLSTKLKALLNSQASFGSTVGAPILFFVGGFIYTVLEVRNSLGDNDIAHALAFGMWWMTIPYLAIISCAMLASNDPSALQGIVYDGGACAATEKFELSFWDEVQEKIKSIRPIKALLTRIDGYNLIELTHDGQFKTVTLWNRGPNKRQWVHEAIKDYTADYKDNSEGFILPEQLASDLKLRIGDLRNILGGTICLIIAPSLLAFLTSYNTPRKGLACRSLTYLVYGISQICEMSLWAWEASLKVKYGVHWSETKTPAKAISWWGQVFVGFFAILAAVGGTLMQVLGVYRTCACRIPVKYWVWPDDPDAYIILSTNFAESIVAASRWWTVTGTVAVVVLSIVTSLAYWHQKRLHKVFQDEADLLDERDPAVLGMKPRVASAGTSSGTSTSSPVAQPVEELKG